jgi:hypothetical protein
MASNLPFAQRARVAQETRERFVAEASRAMNDLGGLVQERLTALMAEVSTGRDMQYRRDVWSAYQRCRTGWVDGTLRVWREALRPAAKKTAAATKSAAAAKDPSGFGDAGFELVGTEVVENKILASRLVLSVMEKVSSQLDDLRLRIKFLENTEELESGDILQPEVLILQMVEQWASAGMPRDAWGLVNDTVQKLMVERLTEAYAKANESLIAQRVMPTIELKDRVKRAAPSSGAARLPPHPTHHDAPSGETSGRAALSADRGSPGAGYYGQSAGSPLGGVPAPSGGRSSAGAFGGRLGWGNEGAQAGYAGAHDETRMMTSTTPLARARSRAQGVLGQLKRLLVGRVDADFEATSHQPASPALAAAIAVRPRYAGGGDGGGSAAGGYVGGDTGGTLLVEDYTPAGVARVAGRLREQTAELKKKAETKNEKATIEIVALMFQAILTEERIPPGIRVWFSRLQMPVLRVALEEPDFFSSLDHPARQLIDRMGSVVLGFDASGVHGGALEKEVKRIVQVIEQYPETGKRVYQLVYEEFQKFLATFLTEKQVTQKVVSVAQQVEQKETLTIQYTIEMRNMLKDIPVREEIREFLFKVWAEVLAVSAVRKGPQHAETITLKKTASDLVWAASAKPNRADRARVIQDLPQLLQRLRSGMTLLGLAPNEQEVHIKTVSDTLADAFLSKTQAIPQAQIDDMAKRLANLEDFVSEDGMGDLPLDAESIEMMLGIEASSIDVIADGGSKPTQAMIAWAQELQLGAWFTLDHNSRITQVQFAWRSDRKHLNLFAATSGHSYLVQAGRLAAYLQAGLLLPQEEETLTVRATRDALAKLEANPERLLD